MHVSGLWFFFPSLEIPADPLPYEITHFPAHADVLEANRECQQTVECDLQAQRPLFCRT